MIYLQTHSKIDTPVIGLVWGSPIFWQPSCVCFEQMGLQHHHLRKPRLAQATQLHVHGSRGCSTKETIASKLLKPLGTSINTIDPHQHHQEIQTTFYKLSLNISDISGFQILAPKSVPPRGRPQWLHLVASRAPPGPRSRGAPTQKKKTVEKLQQPTRLGDKFEDFKQSPLDPQSFGTWIQQLDTVIRESYVLCHHQQISIETPFYHKQCTGHTSKWLWRTWKNLKNLRFEENGIAQMQDW